MELPGRMNNLNYNLKGLFILQSPIIFVSGLEAVCMFAMKRAISSIHGFQEGIRFMVFLIYSVFSEDQLSFY
jgi:hypothetical protein